MGITVINGLGTGLAGGVGVFSSNGGIKSTAFIGIDNEPWSEANSLTVTREHLKYLGQEVYHAGNNPTKSNVGLGNVPNWHWASTVIGATKATSFASEQYCDDKFLTKNLPEVPVIDARDYPGQPDDLPEKSARFTFDYAVTLPEAYKSGIQVKGFDSNHLSWELSSPCLTDIGGTIYLRKGIGGDWGDFHAMYHEGFKPTQTDVGLANVPNWYKSSSDKDATKATAFASEKYCDDKFLPLSGGDVTGPISLTDTGFDVFRLSVGASSHTIGSALIISAEDSNDNDAHIWRQKVGGVTHDSMVLLSSTTDTKLKVSGEIYAGMDNKVYHTANKPSKSDVGLANVPNWYNASGTAGATKATAFASEEYCDDKFLSQSGGAITGDLELALNQKIQWTANTDWAGIAFHNQGDGDVDSHMEFYTGDNGNETFKWNHYNHKTVPAHTPTKWMQLKGTGLDVVNSINVLTTVDSVITSNPVYHAGNKPTKTDVGLSNVPNWYSASSDKDATKATSFASEEYVDGRVCHEDAHHPISGLKGDTWFRILTIEAMGHLRIKIVDDSSGIRHILELELFISYSHIRDLQVLTDSGYTTDGRVNDIRLIPIDTVGFSDNTLFGVDIRFVRDVNPNITVTNLLHRDNCSAYTFMACTEDVTAIGEAAAATLWSAASADRGVIGSTRSRLLSKNGLVYSTTDKPSKSDVGLGNVPNWYNASGTAGATKATAFASEEYCDDKFLPLSGGTLTDGVSNYQFGVASGVHGSILKITNKGINKYATIGCGNSGYAHYQTDATNGHWFNKAVFVMGEIYAGGDYRQRVYHAGNKPTTSDIGAIGLSYPDADGTLITSPTKGAVLFDGTAYNGIYFNEYLPTEIPVGSRSVGFIRQSPIVGQLEIGSDELISFIETDGTGTAMTLNTNTKILDVGAGIKIGGVELSELYLPKTGGGISGDLALALNQKIQWAANTDFAGIAFHNQGDGDVDSHMEFYTGDNGNETFKWNHYRAGSGGVPTQWMELKSNGLDVAHAITVLSISGSTTTRNAVYHQGFKPTKTDVGLANVPNWYGGATVSGATKATAFANEAYVDSATVENSLNLNGTPAKDYLNNSESGIIFKPRGGYHPDLTGMLKIILPQRFTTACVWSFKVLINSDDNNAGIVRVCIGAYTNGGVVHRASAYSEGTNKTITVRFCDDGTNSYILIGKSGEYIMYDANVNVEWCTAGWANYSSDVWNKGWGLSTSGEPTVSHVKRTIVLAKTYSTDNRPTAYDITTINPVTRSVTTVIDELYHLRNENKQLKHNLQKVLEHLGLSMDLITPDIVPDQQSS